MGDRLGIHSAVGLFTTPMTHTHTFCHIESMHTLSTVLCSLDTHSLPAFLTQCRRPFTTRMAHTPFATSMTLILSARCSALWTDTPYLLSFPTVHQTLLEGSILPKHSVYGHITLNTPVLVRSLKLTVEPCLFVPGAVNRDCVCADTTTMARVVGVG